MVELLPARFQGHPKIGCYFFLAFFFFFFFLFLLHLARGCSKKTYFYRVFLHTLLKHLVTSCSKKEVKPKLPQKKVHNFFWKPLFWPKTTFKNTNFAPPPENCAPKNLQKNPIFIGSKKVAKLLTLPWPSYWPYFAQNVAKLVIFLIVSWALSGISF